MRAARKDRLTKRDVMKRVGRSARNHASPPPQSLPIPNRTLSGPALWLSLALILANLVAYAPVWHYGFVNYDDPGYISDNPHVAAGLTAQDVWWAFTTGFFANWHPLTWLSHMLDVELFGMNPGPHHFTSVLLHIANTLLLFWLLHRITGALGRSAFVAGLFAVHPLHVESVAWLSERKDVLSTLFGLLTIWAYVEYVRRHGLRRYLVVLLLFALSLMAKPMLVTLPFVLLLLDFWPLGRVSLEAIDPGRSGWAALWDRRSIVLRLVLEKLPLLALTIVSSVITFVVQQRGGTMLQLGVLPWNRRVGNALLAYFSYIGKTLWPTRLAALYPFRSSPGWEVAAAILGLIGVSVTVIWDGRRHPYLPVGWLWYVGTLVPVIGLIQVGQQSMADRYSYIPLIGLFVIVAWGIPDLLARWPYRSTALPMAAVFVILACMIAARGQVLYWRNSIALWERTLEVTDENPVAHNNLAAALLVQGRTGQAIAHFSEALRIRPDYAEAHRNMGLLWKTKGGPQRLSPTIPRRCASSRTTPRYASFWLPLWRATEGTERQSPVSNPTMLRRTTTWGPLWLGKGGPARQSTNILRPCG